MGMMHGYGPEDDAFALAHADAAIRQVEQRIVSLENLLRDAVTHCPDKLRDRIVKALEMTRCEER